MHSRQLLPVIAATVILALHAADDITRVENSDLSKPPKNDPVLPAGAIVARTTAVSIGACGGFHDATNEQYAAALDFLKFSVMRGNFVHHGVGEIECMKATRAAQKTDPSRRVKYYCLTASYLNDTMPWKQQQPLILEMASAGLLWGISGPNEINNVSTGGGSRGPDDTIDKTDAEHFPANALDWARKIAAFRKEHAAELAGVLIAGPDLAPVKGGAADYPASLNITGLVDYFDFHFYAGSGHQPGLPAGINPVVGYFGNVHAWARAAWGPTLRGILSESGASTDGKNYAKDGISQAKYVANQQLDAFSVGCRAAFTYQLFDGDSNSAEYEANFGLFKSDKVTAKPSGLILRRMQDLRSLNNNADDPANLADTAPFVPGIASDGLTITGMTFVPTSGSGMLVEHKSDGSSIVWLWNEPPIDNHGVNLTPEHNTVTLNFPHGRARAYRIHDTLAKTSLTAPPFATGSTLAVTLAGYPMAVEVAPPAGYTPAGGDPAGP